MPVGHFEDQPSAVLGRDQLGDNRVQSNLDDTLVLVDINPVARPEAEPVPDAFGQDDAPSLVDGSLHTI